MATSGKTNDIVFVGYVGGLGGEAIQPLELAAGLALRGARVTVAFPALPKVSELFAGYQNRPNLTLVETPFIRYDTFAQKPADVLKLLAPYKNADILHLHTGDIALPRMTLLALETLRPAHAFATIQCAREEMPRGGMRARYWASAANRLFQNIVCPSAHGKRSQVAYGVRPDKAVVIYNGADVVRYASGNGAGSREMLGLTEDTPLVVFTARLHEQKRPLDSINAFGKVASEFPAAHFALVGDGPLEADCRARVDALNLANRIHFLGFQSAVPDWLAASTVWILSSVAENFSLGLVEALAAGCAIVATNCPGNDEVLRDNENALVAPVGAVDTLADGLRRLLGNPDLRARLQKNAPVSAQEFSRDKMVERHLLCYDGRLEQPAKASQAAAGTQRS